MSLKDEIYRDWGTIYKTSHRGVAHLHEGCSRIKHKDPIKKDIDVYPKSQLEICSYCEEYFRKWRDGFDTDTTRCDRCGTPESVMQYCDECRQEIAFREAQKR